MATKKTYSFIVFLVVIFVSTAAKSTVPSVSATCRSSLYPQLCGARHVLTMRALKVSTSINLHLRNHTINGYSETEAAALEGCRELFETNVDLINSVVHDLRSVEEVVSANHQDLVHRVRSQLSAVIANGGSCHDSLVETHTPILNSSGLVAALNRSRRVYSVALGLVSQALSQSHPNNHQHTTDPSLPPQTAPSHPDTTLSLSDLIKGLKKPSNCGTKCSKGRLMIPGLQGNGILVADTVTVSLDGTGDFKSIKKALESAPDHLEPEDGYFVIYSKQGVYKEYIQISRNKHNILLLGDGINETVITGNRSNADGWGTSNSATFAVAGDRFMSIGITYQNTYGQGSQAVAVLNRADQSVFFRCSFEGYQDTLYAHSNNQLYRECYVYGTIDFIFGDASAVFQKCFIVGRRVKGGGTVVVTAHKREHIEEPTAFSFHNCTVDAAPDLAALHSRHKRGSSVFLGRPWKSYARVVFMQSDMGDIVDPRGWMEHNGNKTEHNTVSYGEYHSYGLGSGIKNRVKWHGVNSNMTYSQAQPFTVRHLINGGSWLPEKAVPFDQDFIVPDIYTSN